MTEKAAIFHTKRRAFIILPDVGLLVAPKDYNISHEQMLKKSCNNTVRICAQYLTQMTKHGYIPGLLSAKSGMYGKK